MSLTVVTGTTSILIERPLPSLPIQTDNKEAARREYTQPLKSVTLETLREGLRGTLTELWNLDLTGQVIYDTDCPYMGGGAYGDIRIGKCRVLGRGEVKVAVKCLRLYLHDSPDATKVRLTIPSDRKSTVKNTHVFHAQRSLLSAKFECGQGSVTQTSFR